MLNMNSFVHNNLASLKQFMEALAVSWIIELFFILLIFAGIKNLSDASNSKSIQATKSVPSRDSIKCVANSLHGVKDQLVEKLKPSDTPAMSQVKLSHLFLLIQF
jgi:hypothetical protein